MFPEFATTYKDDKGQLHLYVFPGIDDDGSQLYRNLKYTKPGYFLKGKDSNLFKVCLEGENAIDAGGPFREIITTAFEELMSPYLDLFIPTPNNTSKAGSDRDKYTINPQSKSENQLKIFEFLGKMLGYVISSELFMPITLPSFVYKQILDLPIEIKDNLRAKIFKNMLINLVED